VFIHETGHALATVLTGGRVVSMVVTPWESGDVHSVGGNAPLIASAGYDGCGHSGPEHPHSGISLGRALERALPAGRLHGWQTVTHEAAL
jgi:hypothetical protein